MESNQQRETHRQRPDDRGDVQAPAFLLPTVLASLGLDDADVQPPLTADILLHALHDEDYKVRVWAVRVLGRQVGSVAMEPLVAALRDEQWQVRTTAVFVLADLGASAPVKALAAALHDEERAVRTAAVRALSLLQEHALVGEALSDSDWTTAQCARPPCGRCSRHILPWPRLWLPQRRRPSNSSWLWPHKRGSMRCRRKRRTVKICKRNSAWW